MMKKLGLLGLVALLITSCGGGGDDSPNPNPNQNPNPDPITISGTIAGNQVNGTSIDIGQTTVTAGTDGTYSLEVEDGTYEVIPTKNGQVFSPVGRTVTVSGSAQGNVNFTGTAIETVNALGSTWDLFDADAVSIEENTASTLNLTMAQNALWFEASQGGLTYQNVTGNFTLTATVSVRRTSDANSPVSCGICLGGLMARSPDNRDGENYVHIVSGNTPSGLGYETKNTTNNVSPFEPIADDASDHELRICREGSTFRLYQRGVGADTWNLAATYNRPDLPPTLQVGLNIYTAQTGDLADLRVIYENVQLNTFTGSPGCQ